ncbi:MAG: DJ-1/PfpI family protein [Puniceicoccales bacterium]|jgi:4-methyl-5(b-hydroxyethyl)-thiazole monophosphate biosynthesis|nr:DJ-1/PfpI family protein [Puniceicoccales bacterium]
MPEPTPKSAPKVLVIFEDGFEEIEAITPVDILRRAGAKVFLAAANSGAGAVVVAGIVVVGGRSDVALLCETDIGNIPPVEQFAALVLPGGPAVAKLRANPRIIALTQKFADAGKIVGAICAAPLVLKDAGLLEGRRYTVFPGCAEELPDALVAERVVRDGNIITSRSAGTALDFALALVAAIFSDEKANEIAREIVI